MVTSFTRFVVALSFLRAGLGLQTTPANIVLISLALFMTFYVMAPTFDRAWQNGVKPLDGERDHRGGGLYRGSPSRSANSCWRMCAKRTCSLFEEPGRRRFQQVHSDGQAASIMRVLIPAFMISELRRASRSAS